MRLSGIHDLMTTWFLVVLFLSFPGLSSPSPLRSRLIIGTLARDSFSGVLRPLELGLVLIFCSGTSSAFFIIWPWRFLGLLFFLIAFLCYNFSLCHTFRVWYIDWVLRWFGFLSQMLISSDLIIHNLTLFN